MGDTPLTEDYGFARLPIRTRILYALSTAFCAVGVAAQRAEGWASSRGTAAALKAERNGRG